MNYYIISLRLTKLHQMKKLTFPFPLLSKPTVYAMISFHMASEKSEQDLHEVENN